MPASELPDQAPVQQPHAALETSLLPTRALQASGPPFAAGPAADALAPAPEQAAMVLAPALAPQTAADVAPGRPASAASTDNAPSVKAVADALAANQVGWPLLTMRFCSSANRPAE